MITLFTLRYVAIDIRDDLALILDWLNVLGEESSSYHGNRIFFRENAAQHWNSTTYGYQGLDNKAIMGHNVSCVPLVDAQRNLDWRNREVHSYVHNENLQNIHVIPFRDITAPLFNMHAKYVNDNDSEAVDCMNFCFFPQLWQIVWSRLE